MKFSNVFWPWRFLLQFVAHHPRGAQMFMGISYTIGDVLVATVPLARNGFLATLGVLQPNWDLFLEAYGNDLIPVLAAVILIAGSVLMSRGRFALGHAGCCLGALILTLNLFWNHEPWTGSAMTLTVIGGAFGAAYRLLERQFGRANQFFIRATVGSPKKMAGFFFSLTSVPTIFTSVHEGVWSLAASGVCWLLGNLTSMLLPRDEDHAETDLPENAVMQDQI